MKERSKQYKAVFRTKIDFQQWSFFERYRSEEDPDKNAFYKNISDEAIRVINSELKPELQKYTDIPIEEIQVQAVYKGSIEIIYVVIMEVLDLVSGLKDLYDAVRIIQDISERHINKKLSDKFGGDFKVDTHVIVPESRDYWWPEEMRWNRSMESGVKKRDAFFYYLLVANIVLLVIVGALVFGAVKTMYF